MDKIANSSHVVYDGGLSLEKNVLDAYTPTHKQVCEEHFSKACAIEEKILTPHGFEPKIVNCEENSEETGASRVSIQDIFLKMFKAGGLDVVGGAVPFNPSNKHAQKAAKIAVEEYNKIQGDNIELKEVVKAEWQIMGTDKFYLLLQATNGCFFNAEVFLHTDGQPPYLQLFEHAQENVKDT